MLLTLRLQSHHGSYQHAVLFAPDWCCTDAAQDTLQREFQELHMEGAPVLTVKTRSGGPQTPDDSPVAPQARAIDSMHLV